MRDATAVPASGAALTSFELDALTAGLSGGAGTTSETAGAAAGDTALAKAPFDTAIAYRVSGDALVFRIPPTARGIVAVVFLSAWLVGWTVAITFAARMLGSVLHDNGATMAPALFLGAWLTAAVVGEIMALRALASCLATAFGERFLICTKDTLFSVMRLSFVKRVTPYVLSYVRNIGPSGPATKALVPTGEGLGFDYGKRRVVIPGLTQTEAAWVAAALEEHRSPS